LKELALSTPGQQLYMHMAIPSITEDQLLSAKHKNQMVDRMQESIMNNSLL
jgi:hypothetical protein